MKMLPGYMLSVTKTASGNIKLFGSPADRAELEIGDEIVMVNDQSVEGCTHSEIITHIHKCIQSRTIKLRVRRTADLDEDPLSSDINDAYVIAVDDEAKNRLEQLSALHKVKAIDIATLQDLGNNNVNNHVENRVVAHHESHRLSCVPEENLSRTGSVASSVKDSHGEESSNHEQVDRQSAQCNHKSDPDNCKPEPDHCKPDPVNCKPETVNCKPEPSKQEQIHCKPELHEPEQSLSEPDSSNQTPEVQSNHLPEQQSDSCSSSLTDIKPEKSPVLCSKKSDNAEQSESPVSMEVVNGYQDSNSHHMLGTNAYRNDGSRMKYPVPGLTVNHDNVMYGSHHSDLDEDHEPSNQSHREMAIDCPPNFIGVKKETPRYPRGYTNPRNKPESNDGSFIGDTPVPDEEQYNRIQQYQEDLRKRRENEERLEREQDFLRTSLRGSKKLQALEELRASEGYHQSPPSPPSGIINPNYVEEEETSISSSSRAATLPVREHHGTDPLIHKPIGREVLLAQLQHFKKLRSADDQKDVSFLQNLFTNPRFHHAMSTYNKIADVTLKTTKPPTRDAVATETVTDVLELLPRNQANTFLQELRVLLHDPHVKGVLRCHDDIVQQTPDSVTTATEDDEREYLYERASQYGDEIKIVRLQKTADPLGATVRNDGDRVLIGRIVKGGAAEKSGLLHEGDEILEINGNDIRGKSVNDVCDLMASLTGTLTFLIIPSLDQRPVTNNADVVMHIRAHFNYDPEEDLYIPCRELGISFEKGDVLHVLNQQDENWWQAYREGEEDQSLAGLIPSKAFQEMKETMKQTIVADKNEDTKKRQRCRCTRKSNKSKKKKQLYNAAGEELDAEEILTYEEVSLYYPQPNRKRPIVLIGPPNVGRQELRTRLMESDEDRFAAAIPHTSRPRKEDETDGKDYHFIGRGVFEQDITDHRFVEYGEYEKNLYGTSLEAIREVITSGKICVLNLFPQSLRVLKASDLKPYVVFIAPPNIEKLKQLRQKQGVKVTDTELIETIEKSREMEEHFGHYFDQIINYDLDRAYQELISEINKLEMEPQWVPAHWIT